MSTDKRSSPLSIGDKVIVTHTSNPDHSLQGVIAHLGAVAFSNEDDWVGIRLVGSSAGLGENNGSVNGKDYFLGSLCGPKDGLFVRTSEVGPSEDRIGNIFEKGLPKVGDMIAPVDPLADTQNEYERLGSASRKH
eukprot:CAMPEP_0171315232 /NCGR_PEP_ID=MMETSP0816-20121228/61591_1 /TAXON_ID=420281 /ORGANISM="Proboscia inermis, Strain CCAP1064/1" /LENGTH=134 /DNA_ID=CAMNT_0011805451 /DNA_START=143 /DNA_END=544 /DNA_ORIENTATION=+